jgi:hypothetical protein
MTVVRTGLVVTFLLSVLIGGALTEQALESRTRRQAAMQRALINQRQELEAQSQAIAVNGSRRIRSSLHVGSLPMPWYDDLTDLECCFSPFSQLFARSTTSATTFLANKVPLCNHT